MCGIFYPEPFQWHGRVTIQRTSIELHLCLLSGKSGNATALQLVIFLPDSDSKMQIKRRQRPGNCDYGQEELTDAGVPHFTTLHETMKVILQKAFNQGPPDLKLKFTFDRTTGSMKGLTTFQRPQKMVGASSMYVKPSLPKQNKVDPMKRKIGSLDEITDHI